MDQAFMGAIGGPVPLRIYGPRCRGHPGECSMARPRPARGPAILMIYLGSEQAPCSSACFPAHRRPQDVRSTKL